MVRILEAGSSSNLFDRPLRKINELSSRAVPTDGRVKISGVVTLHQPSGHIFLQDTAEAVEVQPMIVLSGRDTQDERIDHPPQRRLSPGDRIEVIGTPVRLPRALVLGHAEYQKTSSGPELAPVAVRATDLLNGFQNSRLVTLKGRLIDRENRPGADGFTTQNLILESDGQIFDATWSVSGPGELPMKEDGYVQVTGIASVRTGETGKKRSSFLLLRGPGDVTFLTPPAFWQRPEALRALGVTGAMALVGLG
jgi:hypothetical protein